MAGTRLRWIARLPAAAIFTLRRLRGTFPASPGCVRMGSRPWSTGWRSIPMNGIIYLVGLIVVIMFILSFLGLR
ncbi:MAG: hypothetical protein QOF14_2376 [Hyphomicrobiales bacterium]|jgi:hypothetical protein|nr:hypothetical protein [Hyphomicrobiales bacterium]